MFCREEYEILEAVQARLVVHPLTAPILGNDHNEFRSRESAVRKLVLYNRIVLYVRSWKFSTKTYFNWHRVGKMPP